MLNSKIPLISAANETLGNVTKDDFLTVSQTTSPVKSRSFCSPDFQIFGPYAFAFFVTNCFVLTIVGFIFPIIIIVYCNANMLYFVLKMMNVSENCLVF